MNNIEFTFCLKEDEYIEAVKEYNQLLQKKNHTKLMRIIIGVLVYPFLFVVTYAFSLAFDENVKILKVIIIYLSLVAVITIYRMLKRKLNEKRLTKRLRNDYHNNKRLSENTTINISDQAISWTTQNSYLKIEWHEIVSLHNCENYIIIFLDEYFGHIIPKKGMGEDVEKVIELINRKERKND